MGFLARPYGRLGPRCLCVYAAFEMVSAALTCLATVALFSLYEPIDEGLLWEIVLVAEACAIALLLKRAARVPDHPALARRGDAGFRGVEAWRAAVGLLLVLGSLSISLYVTLRLACSGTAS